VGESPSAPEVWREIDYASAWAPFDEHFDFKPDFYERVQPAIRLHPDCLVFDLADLFADPGPRIAAGTAAITATALRAFVWLAGEGEMVALNWNHGAYRYSPAVLAVGFHLDYLDWPVPIFPNGDYYAHMDPNLRWGTFGHPWQQSLCLWGAELLDSLGAELLTWLPRHPQSPI
jgi:hypothetical protein